jgi:hypothetical protein
MNGDLDRMSGMLTSTDRKSRLDASSSPQDLPLDVEVVDPNLPADGDYKSESEDKTPDHLCPLPKEIKGPNGKIAHIEYTHASGTYGSVRNYPWGPPNYETVLKERSGKFYYSFRSKHRLEFGWRCAYIPGEEKYFTAEKMERLRNSEWL